MQLRVASLKKDMIIDSGPHYLTAQPIEELRIIIVLANSLLKAYTDLNNTA
jgi:hypothetical protein